MTALKSTPALKATGIEARCAATGMRMTEQRRVIARVLAEAVDHPDVEELYRRCVAVDDKISISTVYRTVKLFEDAGIIERHDFREGRARYEQMRDSHHDHLINLRDGKVIEFTNERSKSCRPKSPASSATSWSITGSSCIACRWTTTSRDGFRHSGDGPRHRRRCAIAHLGISRFRVRRAPRMTGPALDFRALAYN
jgi:Fur family ferric uptake transcriptional regulator